MTAAHPRTSTSSSNSSVYSVVDHDKEWLPPLVAKYGASASTAWLENRYAVWRSPSHMQSNPRVQGYLARGKFYFAWGPPICRADPDIRRSVAHEFLEWAKKEKHRRVVWCIIDTEFADMLGKDFEWSVLSCVREDVLRASSIPPLVALPRLLPLADSLHLPCTQTPTSKSSSTRRSATTSAAPSGLTSSTTRSASRRPSSTRPTTCARRSTPVSSGGRSTGTGPRLRRCVLSSSPRLDALGRAALTRRRSLRAGGPLTVARRTTPPLLPRTRRAQGALARPCSPHSSSRPADARASSTARRRSSPSASSPRSRTTRTRSSTPSPLCAPFLSSPSRLELKLTFSRARPLPRPLAARSTRRHLGGSPRARHP